MSRYPTFSAEELEQKGIPNIDPFVAPQVTGHSPKLSWKDADGNIMGPWGTLYYTPDLIKPWFTFGAAILEQPCFTLRERELSILAVCAAYDCPFVLYVHSEAAHTKAQFSQDQVQAAVDGNTPKDLSSEEAYVYDTALKLASYRGPLEDAFWAKVEPVLAREKIARLAHFVTVYIHICMMTNLANVEVPEEKEGVFRAKKGARAAKD